MVFFQKVTIDFLQDQPLKEKHKKAENLFQYFASPFCLKGFSSESYILFFLAISTSSAKVPFDICLLYLFFYLTE